MARTMSDLNSLRSQLQEKKVKAAGQHGQEFLPNNCLEQLFCREVVSHALTFSAFDIPVHKRESTADSITKNYLKVFAVLLELRFECRMASFIERDIEDRALPVNKDRLEGIIPPLEAKEFVRRQWEYLAYTFRKSPHYRKIDAEMIFPYIEQEDVNDGGSSAVDKVLIHHAHQQIAENTSQKGVWLVRKKIKSLSSGASYKDEAELLWSLKHENIVELLVAYSQDDMPNLLFAPANSDLHEFLLLKDRPKEFEENTVIFKALHGLSSGLKYLHNYRCGPHDEPSPLHEGDHSFYGYHHDIKPRNVLVRGNDFILADFGTSRLKNEGEVSKTDWKHGTYDYGAPECRDPTSWVSRKVGRALDIWSLSCIFMETMVYIQSGVDGVTEFKSQRLFYDTYGETCCFHRNLRLSDVVRKKLNYIKSNTDSKATSEVCLLNDEMFGTDPKDRPNASYVEEAMARVAIKALLECLFCIVKSYRDQSDTNVFRTRLALEFDRLRAWADVLGLMPIQEHPRPLEQRALRSIRVVFKALEETIEKLNNACLFESTQHKYDWVSKTLYQFNDSTWNDLTAAERSSVDSTFSILSTAGKDPQSLQRIEKATRGKDSQYEDVRAVAVMKYMSILLDRQCYPSGRGVKLESSLIEKDREDNDYETRPQTYWYSYGYRDFEKRKVLVEWRGYGVRSPEYAHPKEFERAVEKIFHRVQELVAMLKYGPKPAHFRVLDCLGVFHDSTQKQFGIVYEFPQQRSECVRLQRLLRRRVPHLKRPPLRQKIDIAKALVACVQSFHIAGWVHKKISSHNILFFSASQQDCQELDFDKPFVVGFDHSRQDKGHDYTEGPDVEDSQREYVHPKYLSGACGFEKQFDYYSLGLILLEVGLWKPLSTIRDQHPASGPWELMEKYIDSCKNRLADKMGSTYGDVTRTCLEAPAKLRSEGVETALDFHRDVMEKLNTCLV